MAKPATGTDVGLLVLRLGFAGLMVGLHGWPRVQRVYAHFVHDQPWGFVSVVEGLGLPYPLAFALLSSFAESVAALCVGLGLFTRLAALLLVGNMSVALYSEVSKGDPFELPALYLVMAVTFVVTGGGRFGLTRLFSGRG